VKDENASFMGAVVSLALAFLVAVLIFGSGCVAPAATGDALEDGTCDTDADCLEEEFCLGEWYGEDVDECTPRSDVGESCSAEWPCLEGLTCTSANWCAASATGTLGDGPPTGKH
jgi:hypothetical protein